LTESRQTVTKQKIGVISLFSGCGGLDLGFSRNRYEHISAIDIDKDSIATLHSNPQFDTTEIRHGDITKYDLDIFKKDRESFDGPTIVIGGAPCQPFSKNGYWVSNKRRKIQSDPRNLLDYFVAVVATAQPEGFLFENVESILHPTNRSTYDTFVQQMDELGYKIGEFRANAQDYGAPQKRKRVFVLGTRGDFRSKSPRRTHAPRADAKKLGLSPYVTVGDVLPVYSGEQYYEKTENTSGGKWSKQLQEIPPGSNYLFLTEKRGHPNPVFEYGTKFWNFLLKLDPAGASWTIPASPGPWVGPFHWSSRRLRVPEIAAIQSFPKDYRFNGSRRSVQRQIGNAVPPNLARAFADYLYESMQ